MPDSTFSIIGPDLGGRAPQISTAELAANMHLAEQHPGEWCTIATFATKSSASARLPALRREFPTADLTTRAAAIVARFPTPAQEG